MAKVSLAISVKHLAGTSKLFSAHSDFLGKFNPFSAYSDFLGKIYPISDFLGKINPFSDFLGEVKPMSNDHSYQSYYKSMDFLDCQGQLTRQSVVQSG